MNLPQNNVATLLQQVEQELGHVLIDQQEAVRSIMIAIACG